MAHRVSRILGKMETERKQLAEMLDSHHHVVYKSHFIQKCLLEALLDLYTLLYLKRLKHSNRAIAMYLIF